VTTESINTQNGFEIKGELQCCTRGGSFLLAQHMSPCYSCGPWKWEPLFTTFSFQEQAAMRCFGLPHHMHLSILT